MDERKIAKENRRLLALFNGIDENKVDFVREHIRQLAWYNIRICELQKCIDKDGVTIPFQNGRNQSGLQANPDLRALIDLQKLASAMVKILLPLVPEKQRKSGKLAAFWDEDDEDPEEKAQREREYEERKKKAEEEFQRAVEQQRREREQRDNQ